MIRIRLPLSQARPLFEAACRGIHGRQGEAVTRTLILYGSTLGDTEQVAKRLAGLLDPPAEVASVAGFPLDRLLEFDRVILGTSTWGAGDLQDDWARVLGDLSALDLRGKRVALFGLGDAGGYPDTFVDGLGLLHDAVEKTGADRTGFWPVEGYAFTASRAVVDGRFAGLVLDEALQAHRTGERLARWVKEL